MATTASFPYLLIAVIVLVLIAIPIIVLGRGRRRGGLSPLAGLAFGCILTGILFGEDRVIGYGFLGLGLVLAIADIILKLRSGGLKSEQ